MSKQVALEFFTEVENTPSLKERIKQLKTPNELLELAKEQGYEITADDIKSLAESEEEELSESDLEAIAGGGIRAIWREVKNTARDVWRALW